MRLVVDIRHWLDDQGEAVPSLRRRVLRIARLIEAGGPLEVGTCRQTLVECSCRPKRIPCPGLLSVSKLDAESIDAYCFDCRGEHILVTGWRDTHWATGPMDPMPLFEPEDPAGQAAGPRRN